MSVKKLAWIAVASFFVIILFRVISADSLESNVEISSDEIDLTVQEPTFYLTIPSDTLRFENHKIVSGESFGALLGKRGISTSQIYKIAAAVEDEFNVRRIRAEVEVKFATGDSSIFPSYFIYPESKYEYWIVSLQDSLYAKKVEKKRTVRRREISGTIEDALYLSVARAGGTQALAMSLVEVYAWSIDFFRLQKGDQFSVVYEEEYVDDTTYVGLKGVIASNIKHVDNDFYAFPYKNELGFHDYYDEEGRSLRKTFLRAPLDFTRISSRYSGRRFHPVQKRWKAHLGTDYAAPTGTPIMTTADGVVIAAKYTSANGNYVKVRHNGTYTTQYLHMSKIGSGVKNGVRVKQGDVIGYVGSTGLATGPHVCYRFWVNGKQVDPYKQKLPDAEPLTAERMSEYKTYMDELKTRLDAI
ncbi:MAG TPA: peptidase M23 [Cryomorphaceae bacterium]|nr:peptidase M23 [Cryomorphaceae bacterium]|tara:strand:+ start:9652 stop:10893 length:1242 start_codon:yes stop_codon:yes gene_type:complete